MTSRFQTAYALGSRPTELVNLCLNQLGSIAPDASLGFIYASDALARDIEEILDLLRAATHVRDWVGSVGVALCVDQKEIYDCAAITIMVTNIPLEQYRLITRQQHDLSSFLEQQRLWMQQHHPSLAVVHGDPSNPAIPVLVEELSSAMEGGFLTGALTSSQNGLLQVVGDVTSGGLSGVIFSSELDILAGHTQGCSPIGAVHTITECHRNIVSRMDERPALDVLKQDIGEVLARDLNRLGGYIFAGLPIKGSDTRDYLVRNLLGIDPDRGIIAVGDLLENGDPILFCRRDGNTAREDMLKMLENLRTRIGNRPIKGALYHTCLGRGRNQFGPDSDELALIKDVLGEIPLVGFFANGEIFHNRIYGYTGVLTLFL